MNSERELFEEWYEKNNDFMINTQFLMDGSRYVDRHVRMAWLAWQASAQRQGYKLVPVDEINIMDMIHGKCPCGSSRAPIISDNERYNLIHCFSCGANKYIHEDY
jgi:hypothetical protein